MFNDLQISQLSNRGMSPEKVEEQLELFKKGIRPVSLFKPATPNNGIEVFTGKDTDRYLSLYRVEKSKFSQVKFVPASGAASRMFKQLFEALNEFLKDPYVPEEVFRKIPEVQGFFNELEKYPFYPDLNRIMSENGIEVSELNVSLKYPEVLDFLLSSRGLAYGELPKGLLKFHIYPDEIRTAFEEHFVEGAAYLCDADKQVKLHFTVSPEHRKLFEKLATELILKYKSKSGLDFRIDFSVQKPSTDTIAVDLENKPVILEDGKLLFRPGGHGALLDNMQEINEKIIFVGNIDNVAPDRTKPLRIRFKELLGGVLIERVSIIHRFLSELEKKDFVKTRDEVCEFVEGYISPESASILRSASDEDFRRLAVQILDRPVRVCGMVKNEGEPGGGPYWIRDNYGNISKQIIESSQVDLKDPGQSEIFSSATHFNPVDLACYTFNYQGEKFNLGDFRDPGMAFIAIKSQGKNSVKSLELPGLWNGSMAGWLTFFIEVPVETFSPVKTVFDLRRKEHISS